MSHLRLFRRCLLNSISVSALILSFGNGEAGARGQIASAHAETLTGRVQDPTGAIVSTAKVELSRADGTIVQSVVTDGAGQFRLNQPAAGDYRIAVEMTGFEPLIRMLRVGRGGMVPLTLTMKLASVSSSVSVDAESDVDMAAPEQNGDAGSISADDMKSLPIFDNDVVATLSAFLDAGVSGETGPTLMVDGVASKTVGVAPSAIQRVSINQDPYSAQYWQPGRGQVELITKSTADKFHGAVSFTFRDSSLNASNYFDTEKSPEQRRIYEGYLTGPIFALPKIAFLFSATRQEEDTDNQVLAIPALNLPALNVPAPSRSTSLTLKVSRQYSERHSGFVLYRFFDGSEVNQSVIGQVQPSAGFTATNFDQDITYRDDLILGPTKLNQFSLLFERNIDVSFSAQEVPKLVVQGVVTEGGAQNDIVNSENNPNLSDIFSWSLGGSNRLTHQIKFGVQLPNMGRRILEDRSNWQGTYTFGTIAGCQPASPTTVCTPLMAFQANDPATYTVQRGQAKWLTYHLQPGSFLQDQIQATPKLTVTAGLRYDWQGAFPATKNAFEPRLSAAYLADKQHALVVRVGGGLYVRRVGPDVLERLTRYQHAAEQNLLYAPSAAFPALCNPIAACPAPPGLANLYNYQPNLKSPEQSYFGLSVERQVTKKSTVTIGYNGYRGWHAVRSLDVNAPPPPPYPYTTASTARPNPGLGQVLQLNSGGTQKSDGLNASFRGWIGNVFSGFAQYGLQHADSDTEYSQFNPQNMYNPNADWSRAATDQRQRLALFGTFYPDKVLNLGIGFYSNTPLPYTETDGTDNYDPGIFNARPPGVPRNSLNGGGYQDIQLRWGYNFKLHPALKDASPTVGISVSSFNTLNRVNFTSYDGVVGSSSFRQPTAASNPRRIQLSGSYTF